MSHVIIFSALYIEAAPLIEQFSLKQKPEVHGYACFENEEQDLLLVISGTGKIAMAGAVSAALQNHPCDQMIVFTGCAGLRGQKAGDVFLINRVTDLETGMSCYPDLLYRSTLKEGSLLCGEIPLGVHRKGRDVREPYDPAKIVSDLHYDLYDMDTSGAVISAEKFLGPHQITILKTVTDAGEKLSRESYEASMKAGAEKALSYIEMLRQMPVEEKEDLSDLENTAAEMHCSVVMKAQLRQLHRYAEASGQDMNAVLQEFRKNGILPCNDREEGKKVLHALTRRLTA